MTNQEDCKDFTMLKVVHTQLCHFQNGVSKFSRHFILHRYKNVEMKSVAYTRRQDRRWRLYMTSLSERTSRQIRSPKAARGTDGHDLAFL